MKTPIPKSLIGIKPKVEKLYYKGEYDESYFENSVAIVGSRRITSYGERVLEKLVPPLVAAGVTIVSGYMYGVDKLAHKLALECGGRSIAVLGWGITWGHEPLEKNLLYLSEYKGEQKPMLWMFPKRNRIVAGLSQAVVVIEAARGSGSLITADFAVKYKRRLFAVPGPITSTMSEGTNMLIKQGLAEAVLSAADILESLRIQNSNPQIHKANSNSQITKLLSEEPLSVDEMAKKLNISIEKVGIELSMLQLQGNVFEREGKFYTKNS